MTATARPAKHKTTGFALFEGILPIDRARLPLDVVAGATLAALAIPEVMGYAKIAGTPVVTGLYTLLLPILAFAILGSSRHLVVGADSATAAILATGLVATGVAAGSPQYVEMASLAALMCGVVLIAARLLKLGFIANFLSRSVLIGFLTGVGIQVAMGQVAGMFGVDAGSGTTLEKFAQHPARDPDRDQRPDAGRVDLGPRRDPWPGSGQQGHPGRPHRGRRRDRRELLPRPRCATASRPWARSRPACRASACRPRS